MHSSPKTRDRSFARPWPESMRLACVKLVCCLPMVIGVLGCASLVPSSTPISTPMSPLSLSTLPGSTSPMQPMQPMQPMPRLSVESPSAAAKLPAPPVVASPPPRLPDSPWSTRTRNGRSAFFEHDFEAAEAHFLAALEASVSFRSSDVRVDVSFGNLVRLASVYARIARTDDSKRVMAAIESAAGRRRIDARGTGRYQERYEYLVSSPLSGRFEPLGRISRGGSAPYDRLIRDTADSFDIDPALVKAVVAAESNFEPDAISRVGAQGLMQLMPATARAMGVRRPFAPSENIRGGVRYLRSLLDRFNELDLALAAYNAGPDAVMRYGGIPPYPETEAYVTKVLSHYRRYQTSFSR
jgi:soluble lytic murein transglycosylase-like protein